jgi:class 3 adenylate cyclase
MDPRRDPVRSPEASIHTSQLPEGVVTFLLTDIEGSTPLWETHTAAMSAALARHEALVTEVVASHGGRLISPVARAIRPFPCSFGPLMPWLPPAASGNEPGRCGETQLEGPVST